MFESATSILSNVVFLEPLWLGGLVMPIALLAFGLIRRNQRLVPLVGRIVTITLLFVALASPSKHEEHSSQELAALIDLSQSIPPEAAETFRAQLEPFVEKTGATIRASFFGRGLASVERVFRNSSDLREIDSLLRQQNDIVDAGATNIGAAIDAIVDRGATHVILLTDGQETDGTAITAAEVARARHARIFPLVPDETAFIEQSLLLSHFDAPLTLPAGDAAEVRATLKNSATEGDDTAQLEIWLEQKKLLSQRITVPAGKERSLTVKTGAIDGGLHRIRAIVRPEGKNARTTEEHRWVAAKERSRILFLSGSNDDRRVLKQLFALRGYVVEDIVTDGNQTIPTLFENFSTVVINNVGAQQLPAAFLPALKRYVDEGGRLLLVGGDQSFGLGRYIDTPLEELSPVRFVPPKTTKKRLNSAVILLIDKSRSMLENDKIESAKRAALLSINTMKPDDYIGVIGFDSAPFVVIRLAPVPEVKEVAEKRLRNLTASRRTNMLSALAAARQSLTGAPASRKHIIVLSDGQIADAGPEYFSEVARMQSEGISLTSIGVGSDADVPFLKSLSQQGKGAFYHTLDPSRLPEIFMHDIKVTTGEKTMREREDFPIDLGPAGLVSARTDRFPALRGFVETTPKPGARIELVTKDQTTSHPLLASWGFGRGKVIVFTSDANGRWSLPWLNWSGFSRFWSDLVENLQAGIEKKGKELDFDMRYRVTQRKLDLDLTVFDEGLDSHAAPNVKAEVIAPGGAVQTVHFATEARGRLLGSIDGARPGDYRINVQYGDSKLPPIGITLGAERFGERRGAGIRYDVLSAIAQKSDGRINPSASDILNSPQKTDKYEPLFQWPLLLAFLCAIATIFLREKLESP